MKHVLDSERCEALTTGRWYAAPHRCPYRGSIRGVGHLLCGTHWKALERGAAVYVAGGRRLSRTAEGVLYSVEGKP